ncbi:MAG: DNA gyrase inhibitor YacG [Alkalilacustris sp.]
MSAGAPCPVCRRPAVAAYRPFCSRRCADVDLGRWLGGRYAIPGEPIGEGDDPDGEGSPPRG